jgi:arylsulfatase A-like enzyme
MIHNGKKVQHEGYTTDLITDFSIEWLKQRDPNKPFLLMCQHKAPHREWSPALRHLGHNNGQEYREPTNLFDDYSQRGLAVRDQDMTLEKTFTELDAKLKSPPNLNAEQQRQWDAYYGPRNEEFHKRNLSGSDLVRWRYQSYMHDYLGCIKAVDEGVGRVLDYLDQAGLAENTIVVYSSDQGFFLGEHGWFDKRWIFEESMRTPFVVRWPGVTQPRQACPEIVSNIDFAQTFLEAAGVSAPPEMQGASLVPILKGQTPADWRKSFYYHYYEYPVPHRVRPHEGVVTDRYKLVRIYKPEEPYWELYDRQTDPLEMKSVYNDPSYAETITTLKAELARLRTELQVPEETPRKAFGNAPFDGEQR